MAFCINCGNQLNDGANFCSNCGTAVILNKANGVFQQEESYICEAKRCSSCGDVLDVFATKCPSCGNEIRKTKPVLSVSEFTAKLEEIEKTRPQPKNGLRKNLEFLTQINTTDEQKISLIRSFVFPNNKEDLFEFLILASSNINMRRYNTSYPISESEKAVSDAWEAKFEQAYEKAKLSFGDDLDFNKIKRIYDKKNEVIKNNKKKGFLQYVIPIGAIFGSLIILICIAALIFSFDNKKIDEENERLNVILEEVYVHIENEEYNLARTKAASLVFSGSTSKDGNQAAEKWDATREEILLVIESEETGIALNELKEEKGASDDSSTE